MPTYNTILRFSDTQLKPGLILDPCNVGQICFERFNSHDSQAQEQPSKTEPDEQLNKLEPGKSLVSNKQSGLEGAAEQRVQKTLELPGLG